MLHEFRKALNRGYVVRSQIFETSRALYKIDYIRYENDVYFVKYRDTKLVEICNLSKCKPEKNPFEHGV